MQYVHAFTCTVLTHNTAQAHKQRLHTLNAYVYTDREYTHVHTHTHAKHTCTDIPHLNSFSLPATCRFEPPGYLTWAVALASDCLLHLSAQCHGPTVPSQSEWLCCLCSKPQFLPTACRGAANRLRVPFAPGPVPGPASAAPCQRYCGSWLTGAFAVVLAHRA